MWHTGKVLACGAVGPRFKPRQGQGFLLGIILFGIRMAHYSSGEAGWLKCSNTFLLPMQLASGCMYVWFADSISALLSFLRVLRFPPTPKNRNPSIFLVHSFWFLVVCVQSLLGCLGLNYLCGALRVSHNGA